MEFTNVAASVVSNWLEEYSTSQNDKQSANPGSSQSNRFQSSRPFRCGIGAEHLAESKANDQNYRIDVSLQKNFRKSNKLNNFIATSHTRKSSESSLTKNTKDDQSSGDEEDSKVKAIKVAKELSPHAQLFLATQKKRKRNRRKKKKLNN